MPVYESLLEDATRLPVDDRLQLIEALWDTLPPDAAPPVSAEWLAEIRRRSAEYDSGAVRPIPWEQVRTESLQRLGVTNDGH